MAVQAQQQCLPHDLGFAFGSGGGMLLDAVFGCGEPQQPRSELTSNGNDLGFQPSRKRPRLVVQQALPCQVFCADAVPSRAVGCGAASTSGRASVLSQLCLQDAEVDAVVRLEMERMRLGLQEARRRHLRAVVAAAERAAAGRARAAEAELELARCRNAELEERLRQLAAEGQAWLGVAKSHEAVAAGLLATLDQLLLQQPAAGADDAQSCCFETDTTAASGGGKGRAAASCKACGGAEACVLLLPCRHLCLCRACEAAVNACPVCFAAKNASLQVLLS